jgi:hypothetical protein
MMALNMACQVTASSTFFAGDDLVNEPSGASTHTDVGYQPPAEYEASYYQQGL